MDWRKFSADLTAGLTVSFAAISLGAAFGVMSGRGAFAGMIGAAVIPIIASIFGGTRIQASGPTAPMTAVSALAVAFAYDSFPNAALAEQFITLIFIMNAVFLLLLGLTGTGKLIRLVPNVVILGFMNGIAFLIWADQFARVFAIGDGNELMLGGIGANLVMALVSFGLIYLIMWGVKKLDIRPQIRSFISGVLWSIILMTAVAVMFNFNIEKVELGASVESVGAYLTMLGNYFPGRAIFTLDNLLMAAPFALQLTLLAYLDSLLTALVMDRLTREKSKLNKELVAQGLANGTSALFQGIPGAQATIRSVLLIKEGARSRLAGVLIGVFALISIILLKDYLTLVPAAVFIGVLLKAGLDVCDKDFIATYISRRWFTNRVRNLQFLFILYTTIVTIVVDLNIAVVTGTIFFYIARRFRLVDDVEADLSQVPEPKPVQVRVERQPEKVKQEKEEVLTIK
ncbi:MAG TPA: SulP family inorganic anion transporter [Cyclobacteriaceae bacterium]|nr:SulP family inorganic anion transporter [Cyclobacteriaceae bacterium]